MYQEWRLCTFWWERFSMKKSWKHAECGENVRKKESQPSQCFQQKREPSYSVHIIIVSFLYLIFSSEANNYHCTQFNTWRTAFYFLVKIFFPIQKDYPRMPCSSANPATDHDTHNCTCTCYPVISRFLYKTVQWYRLQIHFFSIWQDFSRKDFQRTWRLTRNVALRPTAIWSVYLAQLSSQRPKYYCILIF